MLKKKNNMILKEKNDDDDEDEDEDEEESDDDDDDDHDDDGVLMMVDVCIEGVVMMVMVKMILWQYAGSNFLGKNPLPLDAFVLMVSVLIVDGVCPPAGVWGGLNCISVVVGVLVALWRYVRNSWRCSVMFWVSLMFSWCFCAVLPVFRWCFGGIEETVFYWVKWFPGQYQIGVNGDVILCYWGCMLGQFLRRHNFT